MIGNDGLRRHDPNYRCENSGMFPPFLPLACFGMLTSLEFIFPRDWGILRRSRRVQIFL